MRKSLLNLYMQKVASGDLSYLDRLCKQLADRLVFTPVTSSNTTGESGRAKATFSVLRINEAHRSLVPLFTTERRFKEWSEREKHSGGSISLLGGDFCSALGAGAWVTLDPGFEDAIELDPVFVAKVAASGMSEEPAEEEPEIEIEPGGPAEPPPVSQGLSKHAVFDSQPAPMEYVSTRDAMRGESSPQRSVAPSRPEVQPSEDSPQGSRLLRSAIFSGGANGDPGFEEQQAKERAGFKRTSEPEVNAGPSRLAGGTFAAGTATPKGPAVSAPEPADPSKKKKSFLSFLKGS